MRHFIVLLLSAVGMQSTPSQATPTNQLPTVTIEMANHAQILPTGTAVNVHVQAHDPDGTVQWLRLYYNTAPYGDRIFGSSGTFTMFISEGANNFQAHAIDNSGGTGVSTNIHVHGNFPPDISIVEPKSTVMFYSLTNALTILAEADDVEAPVTEVRLLHNGTLLASDYQAPYEFQFMPLAFGTYRLEVQAVDSLGATKSAFVVARYLPIFDDFGTGLTLSAGTNVTLQGTTVEATRQKGEPNHAGASGGRSIWFAWWSMLHGTVTTDTFGSDFDTVLGVYTYPSFFAPGFITNLVTVARMITMMRTRHSAG